MCLFTSIGSGDFTQEVLAQLSPVTELGHLRPLACDTTSRDVQYVIPKNSGHKFVSWPRVAMDGDIQLNFCV